MTQTDIHKKAMIEALEKSLGVVSVACRTVGIARNTHYEYYKNDAEYRRNVDSIADIALDFAESKLHKNIENGSDTAIIFYLKTKGKKRGYVERQEIEQTNIQRVINWNVVDNDTNDKHEPTYSPI